LSFACTQVPHSPGAAPSFRRALSDDWSAMPPSCGMAERWGSHHGPVRNNYPAVAAVGRVRIPFARDPAFELNTR
jgi:hypothetical protein